MDFRDYINKLDELADNEPQVNDVVFIEVGDTLLETYIEELTDDGIVIKVNEPILETLINAKKMLKEYMKMGASSDASASGSFLQGESIEEDEEVDEAKYQGREVPLNKPMAGDVKKSKVYVKKPNGNVVKVEFGDKTMRIKKSNPKRRKSFRARHHCENPGPKWKARYWSCRAW